MMGVGGYEWAGDSGLANRLFGESYGVDWQYVEGSQDVIVKGVMLRAGDRFAVRDGFVEWSLTPSSGESIAALWDDAYNYGLSDGQEFYIHTPRQNPFRGRKDINDRPR